MWSAVSTTHLTAYGNIDQIKVGIKVFWAPGKKFFFQNFLQGQNDIRMNSHKLGLVILHKFILLLGQWEFVLNAISVGESGVLMATSTLSQLMLVHSLSSHHHLSHEHPAHLLPLPSFEGCGPVIVLDGEMWDGKEDQQERKWGGSASV